MDNILKTYNLTKQFKNFCAVQNLNMNIKRGEIYGFLGENGAGKTTTIRMIMGLVKSTRGEIEIFGQKYSEKNRDLLKRIGTSEVSLALEKCKNSIRDNEYVILKLVYDIEQRIKDENW